MNEQPVVEIVPLDDKRTLLREAEHVTASTVDLPVAAVVKNVRAPRRRSGGLRSDPGGC
jgi:hypothetical protein